MAVSPRCNLHTQGMYLTVLYYIAVGSMTPLRVFVCPQHNTTSVVVANPVSISELRAGGCERVQSCGWVWRTCPQSRQSWELVRFLHNSTGDSATVAAPDTVAFFESAPGWQRVRTEGWVLSTATDDPKTLPLLLIENAALRSHWCAVGNGANNVTWDRRYVGGDCCADTMTCA